MAWKSLHQQSLADALQASHPAIEGFDDIHALLDWSRFEFLFKDIYSSRKGELAWPPLIMFKALLLQAWHNLSGPALEKALARDLLFRRFPNRLEKEGLLSIAMDEVNSQLAAQSLIIKQGEVSIIDASVIEAKNARPRKNADGENTQDPEAGYSVKQGSDGKRQTTYGFKAHAKVDEDGFIKRIHLTASNVHDPTQFEKLLTGSEAAAYADSAYM